MDDIIAVNKTGNKFKVSWKMTSNCNYRCSYCYMKNEVCKETTPFEKILKIADRINPIIEKQAKGRDVLLHLIGGEVSQYDLIEVLKRVNCKFVIIATHFSAPVSYWLNLKSYCLNKGIQLNIIASMHLEMIDPSKFIEKVNEVYNWMIPGSIRIKAVVTPDTIKKYKQWFDQTEAEIECTVERGESNTSFDMTDNEYLRSLNSKLDSTYFEVLTRDGVWHKYATNIEFINSVKGDYGVGFNPDGFKCTAGLDGIRINQAGDLLRAGCRHASIHKLCSIFDDDYLDKLPTKEWICCTNEADSKGIRKLKLCTCFGNASMERSWI